MGKLRRLNRIFQPDGKTFIVAMDHGTISGITPGLENPGSVLEMIKEGGADAVICNVGVAKKYERELSGLGIILRLDLSPTIIGSGHNSHFGFHAEYALKLGADAVVINAGPGAGVEETTLATIAQIVEVCEDLNLPVVGEMSPGGFDSDPSMRSFENIGLGARIASELGVDFIKTIYHEGFEEIVNGVFCPIVVLGGSKTDKPVEFISSIKNSISAGAAGVAIGRNVWGADNPEAMTRALHGVIHGGMSAEAAAEILQSAS